MNLLSRLARRSAPLAVGIVGALGTCALGGALSGCAVADQDVERWESTKFGPTKLYAVVTHDKYKWPLRIHAALSIIRITPRGGKRLAIPLLVDGYDEEDGATKIHFPGALSVVTPEARMKLIAGMEDQLLQKIKAPPPAKGPDGTRAADESTPYKDVAFAMLQHDPPLVTDEKIKKDLSDAITQWATADFEARIDYPTQQYGIEQTMRFLGASSVKALPELINEQSTKVDRIARLVAEIGEAETKDRTAAALVKLAKRIDSAAWFNTQVPLVKEANARSGAKVDDDRVKKQVTSYQDQELIKVFSAMKSVGGRAVVDYLLDFSVRPENSEDRRKASLAAVEGKIDKTNAADIERLLRVAKDDATPDGVRDLAFNRLGELPKEQIVARMYPLFDNPTNWKVRWVAAGLVLRSLTTKQVPEFMSHLPKTPAAKMAQTEGISYGGSIQKMEAPSGEPKPRDAIMPFLSVREIGPKLTALGYFYGGSAKDVGVVQSHQDDKEAIPKCTEKDDCGWQCEVPKPGTQDKETKEIKTVGDFVRFCVIPSMQGT